MEEKNKRKRIKHVKANRMMVPIITLLLLILAYLIMNFDTICFNNNQNYYKQSTGTITKLTTDKLTMIIPKIELTYKYNEKEYKEEKYFVLEYLYNIPYKEGEVLDIYINTKSPNCTLIKTTFLDNIYNVIIIIMGIFTIMNLLFKIIQNFKYRYQHKILKRKRKHQKEIKKTIKKMYLND